MINSIDITQGGLVGTAWAGVIVAAILTAFRLWIRITRLKKLYWDDFWHVLAFVLLIVQAVLYKYMSPILYDMARRVHGEGAYTIEFLTVEVPLYLRLQFTVIGIFYSCIWSIKLSFMIFYRRFFKDLRDHMIAWWIVLVITLLTYLGAWLCMMMSTGSPQGFFKIAEAIAPKAVEGTKISIKVTTTFDILSDVLIMALPLRLLWGLRISIRQKIGLATIFSFVLIIIAVSIVRVVETIDSVIETHSSLEQSDPVWLALWSIIESSIAVWVSCFPTFRIVFRTNSGSAGGGSPKKIMSPNDSEAERNYCDPRIARKQSNAELIFPRPPMSALTINPFMSPSKATNSTTSTTIRPVGTWENSVTVASSNASDITRVPSVTRYTCALDDVSIPSPTLSRFGDYREGAEGSRQGDYGGGELYYDHKDSGGDDDYDEDRIYEEDDDDGRAEEETYNDYLRRVHRPLPVPLTSSSSPRPGVPGVVWNQAWSR